MCDTPTPWTQPLFDHMSREHGLTLTETEMLDIIQVVERVRRPDSLFIAIRTWWADHKYDTTGEYGELNVYDKEPEFVAEAKRIFGDWENVTKP